MPVSRPQSIADEAEARTAVETGVLKRALRNAGLLLGGKGAAGVMQLVTLALAARTLGLEQFGLFSIILAQMQLLIALTTFQSNQAVVRYGVLHMNAGDRQAFQHLVKFGVILDVSAASLAGLAALLIAPILASRAGWEGDYLIAAQLLALLPLMNAISTPKGMLRLFGRFDLLSHQVVATPLARLVGTVGLAAAGGSLLSFAIVWVIAAAIGAIVVFVMAWKEAKRRDMMSGLNLSLKGATLSNPGVWRFSILSNLQSSFALMPLHVATLVIGFVLGASAAGLTRVAQEIGTALAKPIDLLNQTVYPDIARLSAASNWARLRKLVARSGASAAGLGTLITLALYFVGDLVIRLIFGPEFEAAYWLLLLISAGTTLKVSVFAAEPTLYALGHPARLLITSTAALGIFVGSLFALMPEIGLLAAGVAHIAAAVTTVLLSLIWLRVSVPRGAPQ